MNPVPTLGVAVVGLGIGEQHARAYRCQSACQLRVLCDHDQARAQALANTLGCGRAEVDFATILTDKAVDLVSIASYDDAHAAQTLAVLESGKHVFVEKPLCCSREELERLKQVCQRCPDLKLESNLVLRSAPLYRWLKAQIEAGLFGEIYAFDGDYLYGRLHKITQGWRKDVEHYSVMLGGGIHLIDLMLWLLGDRPRQVSALGNRLCSEGTAFRYCDFVSAQFQFASGAVGRITANFGCIHRHQHVLRVFGTAASFIYDDAGARLHLTRDPALKAAPVALDPLPASKGEL
ncbi:MAG: Gfo/Idh/MocA family oxidoreductase, partial [Spirulinaceae cyanobacterium RM2_2_10]|nr:Gfo/Idh/MocA family oxidoreductase [Spirulinaceae cyanobacterium RM2_2_10]